MYVNTRPSEGLGVLPAAVPVAVFVLKNFNLFTMFGSKLVHGLKPDEFAARHNDPKWFRNLWVKGYWTKEGANEIPAGLSVQDYFVGRFGIGPLIPNGGRWAAGRNRGVPDSSWRLTSVPVGMRWPGDIAIFRKDQIERVLPPGYRWDSLSRRAIPPAQIFAPTRVTVARPGVVPPVALPGVVPPVAAAAMPAAGLPELLRSPILLVGLGLVGFFVMKTMMRPERS